MSQLPHDNKSIAAVSNGAFAYGWLYWFR